MEFTVKQARRGVVLIWALITMAVTTTILGSVGAYYVNSMRIGRSYLLKNEEYYAFLNASGRFNNQVKQLLEEANGTVVSPAIAIGGGSGSDAVTTLVNGLRGLVDQTITEGDYRINFEIAGLDSVESAIAIGGSSTLTVKAVLSKKTSAGGYTRLMAFEEELIIAASSSGAMTTCPIFDYVYFANNRGHLQSPNSAKIIANGDVGANDKFTINGATVNGYVWAHASSPYDTSAVTLLGSPHIWPYATYHKRIASEYREKVDSSGTMTQFYMPVRPTNPIYHGAQAVDWPGGYEPPVSISQYGTIAIDGTVSMGEYPKNNLEPTCTVDLDNPVENPGAEPKAEAVPRVSEFVTTRFLSRKFDYTSCYESMQAWYENYGIYSKEGCSAPPDYNDKSGNWWSKSRWGVWSFSSSKYETAVQNWANNAVGGVNPVEYATWKNQYDAYTQYAQATNTYWKAWNDWKGEKDAWETAQALWKSSFSSDDGIILEKTTVHQYPDTGLLNYIVSTSTNIVEMPNLSDDDEYRQYCQNYVCTNGVRGGTLTCANRYVTKNVYKNIAYSFTFNDAKAYTYARKNKEIEYGHVFKTIYDTSTATTKTRTLANVKVENGYQFEIYPFAERVDTSARVSSNKGEDSFYSASDGYCTAAEAAQLRLSERGSVILIGTANFPITIDGPVYFDGDVVIRGFVSGHGTIYAGRNIHIIGDLTYLNPPSWPHTTEAMDSNSPEKVRQSNQGKDLLMLAARGNIIVGNYASDDWQSACKDYMKISDVSSNACCTDYQDNDIGYSSFNHDYTMVEGASLDDNAVVTLGYASEPYYVSEYEKLGIIARLGQLVDGYACDIRYYRQRPYVVKGGRRYYESILGSDVIKGLMQVDNDSGSTASWLWSSSSILRAFFKLLGYSPVADDNHNTSSLDVSQASSAVKEDANAGDITQIDAILFANHGIFGKVGGTTSKKFKLHGAMICRDEGLLPSFAYGSAFKSETTAEAWLNWDMRIKSGSAEAVSGTGAPATQSATGAITMRETSWRQVQ